MISAVGARCRSSRLPEEIKADRKGLLTVTRYNFSDLAENSAEAIRNSNISGYSLRGRIFQSNPERVPRVHQGGPLPTITRMQLGMTEYAPTPLPAYAEAKIIRAMNTSADMQARRLAIRPAMSNREMLLLTSQDSQELNHRAPGEDGQRVRCAEVVVAVPARPEHDRAAAGPEARTGRRHLRADGV